MNNLLARADSVPFNTFDDQPTSSQEMSVLDAFSEGVFVVEPATHQKQLQKFQLLFANKAMKNILMVGNSVHPGRMIDEILPIELADTLVDALLEVQSQQVEKSLTRKKLSGAVQENIHITLIPKKDETGNSQIIGLIQKLPGSANRTTSLQTRAMALITHANGMESSRKGLENEVRRLRTCVKDLERTSRFDAVTNLPNRHCFLERASAEYRRARRYDHQLSLIVADLFDYHQAVEKQGEIAGDQLMVGLTQIWESASRDGIDIAGRISQSQIAMLLPETGLTGALLFADRLLSLTVESPVRCNGEFVRIGIRTGIDTVQDGDHTVMQSLSRALSTFATK